MEPPPLLKSSTLFTSSPPTLEAKMTKKRQPDVISSPNTLSTLSTLSSSLTQTHWQQAGGGGGGRLLAGTGRL